MTGRAFRSGLDLAHNAQARQTTDDGVPADLKKGPKRFRFDPFTALEIAPNTSDASASNALPALVLPHRLGLRDCRIVIPGAADGNFARVRGSKLGCRCLALATCADTRATSCRELVDPRGPQIQTRIHYHLSLRRNALAYGAPDSFFIGYRNRYRPCTPGVQHDQNKIVSCLNCRQCCFCSVESIR